MTDILMIAGAAVVLAQLAGLVYVMARLGGSDEAHGAVRPPGRPSPRQTPRRSPNRGGDDG